MNWFKKHKLFLILLSSLLIISTPIIIGSIKLEQYNVLLMEKQLWEKGEIK